MSDVNKNFIEFSKPFVDGLKETFSVMVQTELRAHSPSIKGHNLTKGEFTSIIGMNGKVEKNGESKSFRGLIGLSMNMDVFLKVASNMLMEEYTEYCEDIADTAAEIVNIVMGNAKKALSPSGYNIEMATPSTIRGLNVEIKYPKGTTTVETILDCDLGQMILEICYQEVQVTRP